MELESQNIQETKLKAKCVSVCACELMLHPVQPPRRLDSNGRSNVETMTTAWCLGHKCFRSNAGSRRLMDTLHMELL